MNVVNGERGLDLAAPLLVFAVLAFVANSIPDCIHHRVACGGGEFFVKFFWNLGTVLVPAAAAIVVTYLVVKYFGGESSER